MDTSEPKVVVTKEEPAQIMNSPPVNSEAVTDPPSAGDETVATLPEGYSMMLGDDGVQYVTVVQDGQTYALR